MFRIGVRACHHLIVSAVARSLVACFINAGSSLARVDVCVCVCVLQRALKTSSEYSKSVFALMHILFLALLLVYHFN